MEISGRKADSLLIVLFVILQALLLVKSEMTYTCTDHDITISKEEVERMKKCADKVGIKTMEEMTPDKIPCFAKCMVESSGLVDDKGKPHKENILKGFDKVKVPDEAKEKYKKEVEKCIDDHGQNIVPDDPKCASYNALAMCVVKGFKKICHT